MLWDGNTLADRVTGASLQIAPCEDGWYWEIYRHGVKVNGGIARDESHARQLAWLHLWE